MAFAGSEGTGETHEPNHDDDDRVGVAKIEKAAAHFLQEKEDADGYNNDGASKAANGATLAVAMKMIAHRCLNSRGSLLRAPVHPVSKHQDAHGDQNQGPKLRDAVPRKPVKIVEQEQKSRANQEDWADGAIPAEIVERVR